MNQNTLALLSGVLLLSGCGGAPQAQCIVAGLNAMSEAGIHGSTKAENVTAFQCDMVKRYMTQQACSTGVFHFMVEQPEQALRMFVPGAKSFSAGDIESLRGPAESVGKACGW